MRKEVDLDEALEIANKWLINDPDQTTKVETEKPVSYTHLTLPTTPYV